MFIRGTLYVITMMAILLLVGIVGHIVMALLGINLDTASYSTLFVMCAIFGMVGSIISLFSSKFIVKKSMHVEVIVHPANQAEKWLLETVSGLAKAKGVGMPEVGIYNSEEVNAFATGWNRDSALVAVSSGLLDKMEQDEIEAVLGHEMSHVANGDMVTMCLLQGIMNTFVYFLSYIVAIAITTALSGNKSSNRSEINGFGSYIIRSILQMVFGVLASIVLMGFSRWREYRADAGSADVLGKQAMINALKRLQKQVNVSKKPDNVKALCINGTSAFSELFMSHPPLEKRIKALQERHGK